MTHPVRDSSDRAGVESQFQAAYARFLTSERFRRQVLAVIPEGLEGLDPRVIERLRAIDRERVLLFAQLLVGNRIASIREAFPLTAFLLGRRLEPLAIAFGDEGESNDHRKYPEARAIAAYLTERLGSESLVPSYTVDVLGYEFTKLRLRHEYRLPMWRENVNRCAHEFRECLSTHRSLTLHRHPYQALLELPCDVEQLLENAANEKLPRRRDLRPSMVLIHVDEGGMLHQQGINALTAAFLLLIDGRTTFDRLLELLATMFGRTEADRRNALRIEAEQLAATLIERGLLGFDSRPAHASDKLLARTPDGP